MVMVVLGSAIPPDVPCPSSLLSTIIPGGRRLSASMAGGVLGMESRCWGALVGWSVGKTRSKDEKGRELTECCCCPFEDGGCGAWALMGGRRGNGPSGSMANRFQGRELNTRFLKRCNPCRRLGI